jgi:tRNA-specific 2-thiouridylase
LRIAAPEPLYVQRLDAANKKIVVGTNSELFTTTLTACDVHWIYKPRLPTTLTAKIRYGAKFSACKVEETKNFLLVSFSEPQRAITPGQSIVFYASEEVLGGGTIIFGGLSAQK